MSPGIWLKGGNESFLIDKLKKENFERLPEGQLKAALQFCIGWLNNQEIFRFQTSGSTGVPKQITFTRSQLVASAKLTESALGLKSGYSLLVCLDINFIAGAMMLVRGLVTGMNMIIARPSSNPLDQISDPIDFASFVPVQMESCLTQRKKIEAIKKIIIGGAAISDQLGSQIEDVAPEVYATYGMTETISHVALQKLNGPNKQDYFQFLPEITGSNDSRGCLTIRANHLQGPVITNDIVEWIASDKFRWLGRLDRVINSGGIKIQAEAIEKIIQVVLEEYHLDNRFFVAGIPHPKFGEVPVWVIEGKFSEDVQQQIFEKLSQRLTRIELPKQFYFVPQFKETSTQKIDRNLTLLEVK